MVSVVVDVILQIPTPKCTIKNMTKANLDLISMIRHLIATPSMSSVSPAFDTSNLAVIELLATWLEDFGFSVEVMPLPNQPDKANLLASIGPLFAESQGLMFAGHTDTVPYDAGRWRYDPFKLVESNQRLYGLGSSDMKAFFAIVLEALKGIEINKLQQPVFILATADEESSMMGARRLVERGCPGVRYAVIGEPTGLQPINAHKGIMMESIRLTGRAGHSSNPDFGASALEAMHGVIGDILAWRKQLQADFRDEQFSVPVPTLNFGHIKGGDNPNRICGECELHIDLRPLPGMALAELREEIEKRLQRRFKQTDISWQLEQLFPGTPALHTPASSPLVQEAEALTKRCCGAVAFCTEAPYLSELGIETIVLGPGDIDQAHQPDEYLALDRIDPMQQVIQQLVKRFCYEKRRDNV